jgi:hypothetical protein
LEIVDMMRHLLTVCAPSRLGLIYEDGLRVPANSLFARRGPAALGGSGDTQIVRTPDGLAGGAELLVPERDIESASLSLAPLA